MDKVAAAIADPVRRRILLMLRDGRLSAGQIAARFPISRPAISRHLRVLRESGLVQDTLTGRQRLYRLDATRLAELGEWLDQFRTAQRADPPTGAPESADMHEARRHTLVARLDALETEVYRTRREHRRNDRTDRPEENIA